MEKLPFEDGLLEHIQAWGVVFYARSQVETFMEFNRVLATGGSLIFNMVTSSTQGLAQTVDRASFIKWVCLFGFELVGQIEFYHRWHQQVGLRLRKTRAFDPAYFRLPQCQGGKIANYLPDRDWYLE